MVAGTLLAIIHFTSSLTHNPEWDVKADANELAQIQGQKFSFLGEGAQVYAFESEDHKYVLKLFKMKRFTPSWNDYLCPKLVARRLKNLRWIFNGYKTAYQEFKEDSGLIFVHLNKTDHLKQSLTIVDAEGKEYLVDLDKTEFIVQEKVELIFDRLKRLLDEGATQAAEESIAAVLDLVKRRVEKGYADRDSAVSNNYGFVGNRPVHLDSGRLFKGEIKGQVERTQGRIERWKQEYSVNK